LALKISIHGWRICMKTDKSKINCEAEKKQDIEVRLSRILVSIEGSKCLTVRGLLSCEESL
jgi:hypothetical protein